MNYPKVPVGTVLHEGGIAREKRWEALMPELEAKARHLHAELAKDGMFTISLHDWLEGFLFDMHPDREIAIWEKIIAMFRQRADGKGRLSRERIWKEIMAKASVIEIQTSPNN